MSDGEKGENVETEVQKQRKYGSRFEVFDLQTATMTRGGLTKEDLTLSRTGRIVSKKKQAAAKKSYAEFGFAKRTKEEETVKKPRKKRRRKKKE